MILLIIVALSLCIFSACSDIQFKHKDFQEFEVELFTMDFETGKYTSEIVTTQHRTLSLDEPYSMPGYDFDGWRIVEGISGSTLIIGSKWEESFPVKHDGLRLVSYWVPKKEMKHFEFVSTKDTCRIVGVKETAPSELFVPYYVTEFGSDFGGNLRSVVKVTFEQGSQLKSIAANAFYMCSNLREINLPEGLESIGVHAFYECSSLAKVTFPSTLKTIGGHAFSGCRKLKEITLPEGIQHLNYFTFSGCYSIETINLPKSLESIDQCAFSFCTSLKTSILQTMDPCLASAHGHLKTASSLKP